MENLPGFYSAPLVVVSILVAVLASYTAQTMAARVAHTSFDASRWWLAGGAVAMGTGIWSMHFIGMLALRMPIPLGYDPAITLVSWLLAVAMSTLALTQLGQTRNPGWGRLLGSAVIFGLGINAMHYVGMMAMRMVPGIVWNPWLVLLSCLIAIVAAAVALWIAFGRRGGLAFPSRLMNAIMMGVAIAGMHYTGMAAASFPADSVCLAAKDGVSLNALAVVVAVATFGILAIALLTSVYDARLDARLQILKLSEANALERQRLLESERAFREEAERMSRIKDEFLATLSHELRTPLNSILGWAQLLQIKSTDETVLQGAATIDRNARLQAQLIEDLLDMSRIIAGKIRLNLEPAKPSGLLRAAIEAAQPAAAEKQIQLSLLASRTNPVMLDPDRFQQVMWNLLSNAIKFTPEGGQVQVNLSEFEGKAVITVTDSGVGIAPEFLPHLFERFRQADATTTRRQAGLGIGLSIARQLVELHQGTLTASSEGPGKGSIFTITLPVLDETPGGMSTDTSYPIRWSSAQRDLDGYLLLVVDDEADAREVVCQLLLARGAEVHGASSVDEALMLIRRLQPHVVISDIAMPERDGYELIRELRASAAPVSGIPVIALTAFAHAEDRARIAHAGFDVHLVKPVDTEALSSAIRGLAKPGGHNQASHSAV